MHSSILNRLWRLWNMIQYLLYTVISSNAVVMALCIKALFLPYGPIYQLFVDWFIEHSDYWTFWENFATAGIYIFFYHEKLVLASKDTIESNAHQNSFFLVVKFTRKEAQLSVSYRFQIAFLFLAFRFLALRSLLFRQWEHQRGWMFLRFQSQGSKTALTFQDLFLELEIANGCWNDII